MPDQIFPASYGAGVAIGYHEKVIRHRGDGVIVMVRDDDAVVLAPRPLQEKAVKAFYKKYGE